MDFGRYTRDEAKAKILERVIRTKDGCWEWHGANNGAGYGRVDFGRTVRWYTHRAMYTLVKGPIPKGLQIDHLCRNPKCCNPDHLEPVTSRENTRRGRAYEVMKEKARAQTHCGRGHPINKINTYTYPDGSRQCRLCVTLTRGRQKRAERAKRENWHKLDDGRNPLNITYKGKPASIQVLADQFGIDRYTLRRRITSGWPEEKWHIKPNRKNRA